MSQGTGWRIIAVGGPSNGTVYPITEQGLTLGRSDECEIALASQNVSRKHARFFMYQDIPYVQDLGSRNGVYVNGVRIQNQPLASGDSVTMGEFTFQVTDGTAPPIGASRGNKRGLMIGGGAVLVVLVIAIAAMSGGSGGSNQNVVAPTAAPSTSEIKSMFEKSNNSGGAAVSAQATGGSSTAPAPGGQEAPVSGAGETRSMVRDYLDRAEILREAGKYHEAREQYERALKMDPGCQICLTRRDRLQREIATLVQKHLEDGMKAFNALRYEDAISSWELVVNLSPDQGSQAHQQALKNIRDAQARLGAQSGY